MAELNTTGPGPDMLELRRRPWLPGVLALGAGLVAVLYLTRAVPGRDWLDWVIGVISLFAALGFGYLARDARAPVLRIDTHGVRLRLGEEWLGITWPELAAVEYIERQGVLGDGKLAFRPHHADAVLRGVGVSGRRQIAWTRRFLASDLAVSLDNGSYWVGTRDPLPGLRALKPNDVPLQVVMAPKNWSRRPLVNALESEWGKVHETASSVKVEAVSVPVEPKVEVADEVAAAAQAPTRPVVSEPVSIDAETSEIAAIRSELAIQRQPTARESLASALTGRKRNRATGPEPDDWSELAPSIGAQLRVARQRQQLSVEGMASLSKIPTDSIRALESDQFSFLGGDFYARSHIQTLARFGQIDPEPLLSMYDQHYSGTPASPGITTSTADLPRGQLNWSVLVAVVMGLILAWSVTRLVVQPTEETLPEVPILNAAPAGSNNAGDVVPISVSAAGGQAHVVIRDADGALVFRGDLPFGTTRAWQVRTPVQIETSDGSVLVEIDGHNEGAIGATGKAASNVYAVMR